MTQQRTTEQDHANRAAVVGLDEFAQHLDAATAWVVLTTLTDRLRCGLPLVRAVDEALAEGRACPPTVRLELAQASVGLWAVDGAR